MMMMVMMMVAMTATWDKRTILHDVDEEAQASTKKMMEVAIKNADGDGNDASADGDWTDRSRAGLGWTGLAPRTWLALKQLA